MLNVLRATLMACAAAAALAGCGDPDPGKTASAFQRAVYDGDFDKAFDMMLPMGKEQTGLAKSFAERRHGELAPAAAARGEIRYIEPVSVMGPDAGGRYAVTVKTSFSDGSEISHTYVLAADPSGELKVVPN